MRGKPKPPRVGAEGARRDSGVRLTAPRPPTRESLRSSPPRVLFLDDETASVRAFQRTFDARGFAVTGTSSVEKALHLARSRVFEVFVVDLHLEPGPGGRPTFGLEVCRQLLELNPNHAVVVYTGLDLDEAADLAFAIGVTGFLSKLMDADRVATRLRAWPPVDAEPEAASALTC